MSQAQRRHEGHGQHTWPGAVHHLLNSHLAHLSCRIFFGKLCTTLLCECPQTLSPCVRVWPARLVLWHNKLSLSTCIGFSQTLTQGERVTQWRYGVSRELLASVIAFCNRDKQQEEVEEG